MPIGVNITQFSGGVTASQGNTVSFFKQKDFVTNLEIKPCGCLENTKENIQKVRTHCYETYCSHYAPCSNVQYEAGYRIFEESGLMQLDFNYHYDNVYLEYRGYLSKVNGQYMIPEYALETLSEYIKWKAIKDRKGVERWRILDAERSFTNERRNMLKIKTQLPLDAIIAAARRAPRFEVDYGFDWNGCFTKSESFTVSTSSASSLSSCGVETINGGNGSTIIINKAPYQLSVKTGQGFGHPIQGASSYQNDLLKGATETEFLLLAKQLLTKIDGDFTLDATTGTINIYPLIFIDGDSLVLPYNKIN